MRRVLSTAALLTLLAAAAQAQVGPVPGMAVIPAFPKAAAAGYTGPGDVVSGADAFWGLRAYNAAYAASGGAAFTYECPANGSVSTGTVHVTATGGLKASDVSAMTSACGANSQYYATMVDQTGNGKTLTGDTSFPPQYVGGCIGTLACIWFYGQYDDIFASNGSFSQAQPLTVSAVAERHYGFTGNSNILSSTGGGLSGYYTNSANTVALYAGSTATATASDSAAHALQFVFNGSSSVLVVDSSATTGLNPGSNGMSGTLRAGDAGANSNICDCYLGEIGVWPGAFNSTQYAAMHTNQSAWWGTP